jgi:hypothetical protein
VGANLPLTKTGNHPLGPIACLEDVGTLVGYNATCFEEMLVLNLQSNANQT